MGQTDDAGETVKSAGQSKWRQGEAIWRHVFHPPSFRGDASRRTRNP